MTQVLEHAFRHLAWLVKGDDAVRAALPDWMEFLDAYEPDPFEGSARPYLSRYPEPSASTMVHMVASVAVVPAMAVSPP